MNKGRKMFLDVLKMLAAAAVILYHVICSAAYNDPQVSAGLERAMRSVAAVLSWHVPVFFMITGYLWLGSGKTCTFQTVRRNLGRFVLALLTVGFAYALMERVFDAKSLSPRMLKLAFTDVLNGNLWDHMWYLYAAIGVYLFLPAVKPFFSSQPQRANYLFVAVLFGFTVLFPAISDTYGYTLPIEYPITAPAFYVCMGGLLAKGKTSRFAGRAAGVVLLLSCVLQFAFCRTGMSDLLKCLSAVSLFILVRARFGDRKTTGVQQEVAKCTFGIYLFHPLFVNLFIKVLHLYPMGKFLPVSILLLLLMSAAVAALSFLLTYLLRKNRFVREYLL